MTGPEDPVGAGGPGAGSGESGRPGKDEEPKTTPGGSDRRDDTDAEPGKDRNRDDKAQSSGRAGRRGTGASGRAEQGDGAKKAASAKATRAKATPPQPAQMRGEPERTEPAKPEPRKPIRWTRWIVAGVAGLLVAIVAFVAAAQATDVSSFCGSCHEMQPYYQAWTQSPHARTAQCVDCHVDAGTFARLSHKFNALVEVWAHFTGFGGFPLAALTDVPDYRCVRCHPTVATPNLPSDFSHALHAKQGPCVMCHSATGHGVTAQALQAAGVYNAANAALQQLPTSAHGVPGKGKPLTGHLTVVCSNCHDMTVMNCSACHSAPHEPRGDCGQCHKPGASFTFRHPPTGMPNSQKIPCRQCHPVSFRQVYCTCHKGRIPKERD